MPELTTRGNMHIANITFIFLSFIFPLCHFGVQVIAAADEVVGSIDKEELAKYLSLNSDPEDEEAQVTDSTSSFWSISFR